MYLLEEMTKVEKESRRDLLKRIGKTAAFVIPSMVTFSISSLAVKPSGSHGNNGNHGNGNNGNHGNGNNGNHGNGNNGNHNGRNH
jgi:hypothetical protein